MEEWLINRIFHDQGRIVEALGAQALRGHQREAVGRPSPVKFAKNGREKRERKKKGKERKEGGRKRREREKEKKIREKT